MEKLVALAILTAVSVLVLRQEQPVVAYLLLVASAAYLLFYGLNRLNVVVCALQGLIADLGIDSDYYYILIKILGIALVGEIGTAFCRDAGCQSLAEQISMTARFSILAVSLPVLLALVEVMRRFV